MKIRIALEENGKSEEMELELEIEESNNLVSARLNKRISTELVSVLACFYGKNACLVTKEANITTTTIQAVKDLPLGSLFSSSRVNVETLTSCHSQITVQGDVVAYIKEAAKVKYNPNNPFPTLLNPFPEIFEKLKRKGKICSN